MHVLPTISYLATDACSYSAVVPAALTISFASGLVTTGYPHLSLVPIGVFHDLPLFLLVVSVFLRFCQIPPPLHRHRCVVYLHTLQLAQAYIDTDGLFRWSDRSDLCSVVLQKITSLAHLQTVNQTFHRCLENTL